MGTKHRFDFMVVDPVFGGLLNCYIGWSYADMLEEIKKTPNIVIPKGFDNPEHPKDAGSAAVYLNCGNSKGDGRFRVLWLPTCSPSDVEWQGTLLHECVHHGQYLLADRGVAVDHNEPEPMAYYVQFTYQTIVRECKRKLATLKVKKI